MAETNAENRFRRPNKMDPTMYGLPPRFSHRGGGQGQPPPQQPVHPPLNPNYLLNNNNHYLQAPNLPIIFPNFPLENPNIHTQNLIIPIENHNFQAQNLSFIPHKRNIKEIDEVVVKVRRELIGAGENVSAVKVSQAALVLLKADSWDWLGVPMRCVPSLYRLMLIEGKINAFINCFVETWKITTLSDLETEICKNQEVKQFEELELGPLVRHPLVNHYFCMTSDSTGLFRISGEEVVNFLVEFMEINKGKKVKVDELLDFIAKKRSVDSKEKLHVRIQSLGFHYTLIQKARPLELSKLKKCLLDVGYKPNTLSCFMSRKKQRKESHSAISERVNSFSSGNDDNIKNNNDNEDETCLASQSKNSSQILKNSVTGKNTRLGILKEKEDKACNESVQKSNKKRKLDAVEKNTSFCSRQFLKKVGISNKHSDVMSLDPDSMMMFITMWKDACKKAKVHKVMQKMLKFYKSNNPNIPKEVAQELYTSYPLVGLINVAIKSIEHGMWDSMYDTVTVETKQADDRLVVKHVSKQHCENFTSVRYG